MSERYMRANVVLPELEPLGAFAVENAAQPGTPDVACRSAWLELKKVPKPRDPSLALRVRHFRPEQRSRILWMAERGHRIFLLLQVGRTEWLLLNGAWAARFLGSVSLHAVRDDAARAWSGTGKLTDEREGLCAYLKSLEGVSPRARRSGSRAGGGG